MALKQLLKGEYADDVNLLGTGLEIGAGFIPLVGQAQSGRDLTHNLQNWEWSWGHAGVTALNAFGLIPVVGGLRVVGRVSRVVPASEIRRATRATRAVGGGASTNNARVASRFSGGGSAQNVISGTSYDINKVYRTQPRSLTNEGSVRNMMESITSRGADAVPPIPIRVHQGNALIVDGHHRLEAFSRLGYDRIPIKYIHENQIKHYGRTLEDLLAAFYKYI